MVNKEERERKSKIKYQKEDRKIIYEEGREIKKGVER